MMRREIILGEPAWATECAQYPLPPGLPAGTLLRIAEDHRWTITVCDPAGTEWTLHHHKIDPGWYFHIGGRWVPETHPECQEHIARSLDLLRSERWQPTVDDIRLASIANLERIQARFPEWERLRSLWCLGQAPQNGHRRAVLSSASPHFGQNFAG